MWSLMVWICLFWTFQVHGIVEYVTFCDWIPSLKVMFSRFFHVVAVSELYYFLWLTETPVCGWATCLCVHQLTGIWVTSPFGYSK